MEKQRIIQALQQELHAIAELHTQLAERTSEIANILASLDSSSAQQLLDSDGWSFPPNDYGKLVTYLTSDPIAKRTLAKRLHQSWPNYAIRLSKKIGWDVEPRTLRRCFERHGEL